MRVKTAAYTRKRKKDFFKLAKGYYGKLGSAWRMVKQQVPRSLAYMYRDRRDKKNVFRRLWISRINSAVREFGMKYNEFIHGLKKSNILLDRKMLAYLAVEDQPTFKYIVDYIKNSLNNT